MKKIISVLAAAAMLTLPFAASAATISTPLFSNGDTTIDAQGGSTVSGTFTLQVGANEVCEVIRTQAAPQAITDTSVGGQLGYQEGTYTNVPFSVKVSPNTGTYNATAQCAGIWGGNRAVDGADNVVVGPVSLGTIDVVANSSTGGTGSTGGFSSFADLVAALKVALGIGSTTPAPTGVCSQLAAAQVGAQFGVHNQANVALQGFLLSQHESIPALAAGAAFGFWGNQTQAALTAFTTANHC